MDDRQEELLPGSRACVGCGGLTFRQRDDGLCPRCAFEAESLIERIELDGLDHDLELMTRFEAYYQQREVHRQRFRRLAGAVFGHRPSLDPQDREPAAFAPDAFWAALRDAS